MVIFYKYIIYSSQFISFFVKQLWAMFWHVWTNQERAQGSNDNGHSVGEPGGGCSLDSAGLVLLGSSSSLWLNFLVGMLQCSTLRSLRNKTTPHSFCKEDSCLEVSMWHDGGNGSGYPTAVVRELRTHCTPCTENGVQWLMVALCTGLLSWYECLLPDLMGSDKLKLPTGLVLRKLKCPRPAFSHLSAHRTSFSVHHFWLSLFFLPSLHCDGCPSPSLLFWHFTLMLFVDIIHFPFILSSFCALKILSILHLTLLNTFFSCAWGEWCPNVSGHKVHWQMKGLRHFFLRIWNLFAVPRDVASVGSAL